MKIGFIGSGNIGSVLARHWVKAGHEVIVSSRHSDKLKPFVKSLGPKASIGTPEDAALLGDIVVLSIPLGEIPKLSREIKDALLGKIVIDTNNPYPERDGKYGEEALKDKDGSGVWVSRNLPGARIVKAFNAIHAEALEKEAHRKKDPIAIPLASDDQKALPLVAKLVEEAGFVPVIVGELKRAKEFDNGTPPYGSHATASELQGMLKKKLKLVCSNYSNARLCFL